LGERFCNILAIFLKPLIWRALSTRQIKGFRKMPKLLILTRRQEKQLAIAPNFCEKHGSGVTQYGITQ